MFSYTQLKLQLKDIIFIRMTKTKTKKGFVVVVFFTKTITIPKTKTTERK